MHIACSIVPAAWEQAKHLASAEKWVVLESLKHPAPAKATVQHATEKPPQLSI
jgi:hypothetical protein